MRIIRKRYWSSKQVDLGFIQIFSFQLLVGAKVVQSLPRGRVALPLVCHILIFSLARSSPQPFADQSTSATKTYRIAEIF